MSKRLFICGCPRSGTSAFGRIINLSDEVVIGLERYSNLIRPNNFQLRDELFQKERFFAVQEGDTFYQDFEEMNKHYSNTPDKYDRAKYVGDKAPYLYMAYNPLFSVFPDAIVLFIYRDVREVADSYQNKVLSAKWSEKRNYKAAVKDWNTSIYLTSIARKKNKNILCVDYDTIFRSCCSLKILFESLGLRYTTHIKKSIIKMRHKTKLIDRNRKHVLDQEQIDYIEENYRPFLEELILPYNMFWTTY